MADYYPLLARALDGLPEATPEARAAVYDRAKTALASQLRSVQPALGESEIARERASLDEAIERIERAHLGRGEAAPRDEMKTSPRSEHDLDGSAHRSPAIRRGGTRRGRPLIFALALVGIIAPLAVAAWLWRDQPQPVREATAPRQAAPETPAPASPTSDPKFSERVSGGQGAPSPAPAAPGPAQPSATPAPAGGTAPAPAASPSRPAEAPRPQPDLAVSQRAALVEENTTEPQQPKVTPGQALWRLDAVNSGQGQPLETIVRATIDVPEAGLSLMLTIRRNRDATLPASHTIDLAFTTSKPGETGWVVRDVNPPLLRQDDSQRGVSLAGLSVPVKENLFLIGLSDLRADVDRNTEMLRNRNWIELPLRFASGVRATLVFEKGVSGDRVMADAFRQWAAP